MTMWATRDISNYLTLWRVKPVYNEYLKTFILPDDVPEECDFYGQFLELDSSLLPNVTFEKSPVEVVIEAKEQLNSLLEAEFERGKEYGMDVVAHNTGLY